MIRAARRAWAAACVGLVLCCAACSPRYNWRELSQADGYSALFPARVAHDAHVVELAGYSLPLRMTAAEVGQVTFAVGTVNLPAGVDARAVEAALMASFATQLGAPVHHAAAASVARAGSDAPVAADAFSVEGVDTVVFGRVVASGALVIEALVAGPPKAFTDAATRDARDTFLTALKLN